MVHQLLLNIPVKVGEVGAGDRRGGIHRAALDPDLELDIVRRIRRIADVLERHRVALLAGRGGATERFERVEGDHPRRDRGRKVLGSKRTERHVLPLLDVACTPVVHDHHTEDVVLGILHRDRLPGLHRTATNKEGHFELEVEKAARAVHAALLGVILIFLQLARRTRHIGAGHVHGTGAPVVADWQVKPKKRMRQVDGVRIGKCWWLAVRVLTGGTRCRLVVVNGWWWEVSPSVHA
mmetsp:Transcript_75718/g.215612  ORF Transcript_75718/g.215612 Transcript_75718/m.215612 type:complete len:237 (-) Transcript_75718:106-816(-)